jgi:hypothetical protein
MRVYAAEGTLILGKLRRDGSRRVLAVRLMDWKEVATALHKQEMPACIGDDGKLYVHLPDRYQRLFFFLEEGFPGEISPANRTAKRNGVRAKARKRC